MHKLTLIGSTVTYNPELLNLTRSSRPVVVKRKAVQKTEVANALVKLTVFKWRQKAWDRDHEDPIFGYPIRSLTRIGLERGFGGWVCLKCMVTKFWLNLQFTR